MCRTLRWAAGVLLAIDVSGLASSASAQTSVSPLPDAQRPIRTVRYEERVVATEGHNRLEEMKVQLALLADMATFPYQLRTHAAGGYLQLLGFVPNTTVKQLALELAQRSTFMKVADGLKIQSDLKEGTSPRGVEYLQIEGKALLAKRQGEASHPIRLSAQPNGMVMVTGSVYSVEEKLAISQLFRQLTGCTGVLNQLTVLPVLHDGQRVVRVTRDGALTMPETALKAEAGAVPAARKMPAVLPAPTPAPTPIPSPKVEIKEEELHLPSNASPKPSRGQPATTIISGSRNTSAVTQAVPVSKSNTSAPPTSDAKPPSVDILAAPKVPASWSRGVITWESDPPTKPATVPAPKPAANGSKGVIVWESEPPKSLPSPAKPTTTSAPSSSSVRRAPAAMRWESEMQAKPSALAPTLPPVVKQTPPVAQPPAASSTAVKPQTRTVSQPPATLRSSAAPPAPAVTRSPIPQPTNNRPEVSTRTNDAPATERSAKMSDPTRSAKISDPTRSARVSDPAATPVDAQSNGPATPPAKALTSPRRWPPAFDIRPPVSEWGQPGAIAFEEEQEPSAPPAPRPVVAQKPAPPPQLVASEPLTPKLAPPEPLIPTPPPPKPAARSSLAHSRTTWSAWPVSPTDLKQRIESICGRLAKDVQVQPQRDGSVFVKVKVVNAAAERQLTNKILTIPEITAPNVHLEMAIGK